MNRPTERVLSCAVKVSRSCPHGHLTQIGNHSRLTISYVNDHGPLLIVHNAQHQELLRMVLEIDVTRYTVISQLRHEISRDKDSTITLDFYREDKDAVKRFRVKMEDIFRGLHRFSSNSEVRDSSSSGSDDDAESNGATATAATNVACMRSTPIVTYWECANCHYASSNEHGWTCGECSVPRVVNYDLEWQCHCCRVYSIMVTDCKHCQMWRCYECTLINKSSSPNQCSMCGTYRWI